MRLSIQMSCCSMCRVSHPEFGGNLSSTRTRRSPGWWRCTCNHFVSQIALLNVFFCRHWDEVIYCFPALQVQEGTPGNKFTVRYVLNETSGFTKLLKKHVQDYKSLLKVWFSLHIFQVFRSERRFRTHIFLFLCRAACMFLYSQKYYSKLRKFHTYSWCISSKIANNTL